MQSLSSKTSLLDIVRNAAEAAGEVVTSDEITLQRSNRYMVSAGGSFDDDGSDIGGHTSKSEAAVESELIVSIGRPLELRVAFKMVLPDTDDRSSRVSTIL